MAGIKANSVSATMGDGDTAVDKSVAGYITDEQVVLTTTPTGAAYSWGIAKPAGATSRSDLSSTTVAAPTFTPDVPGYYVLDCVVDSTTSYVIRVNVTQVAIVTSYEAIRLAPKADADVPTPATGCAIYWSSTQDAAALKKSDGTIHTFDLTAV